MTGFSLPHTFTPHPHIPPHTDVPVIPAGDADVSVYPLNTRCYYPPPTPDVYAVWCPTHISCRFRATYSPHPPRSSLVLVGGLKRHYLDYGLFGQPSWRYYPDSLDIVSLHIVFYGHTFAHTFYTRILPTFACTHTPRRTTAPHTPHTRLPAVADTAFPHYHTPTPPNTGFGCTTCLAKLRHSMTAL